MIIEKGNYVALDALKKAVLAFVLIPLILVQPVAAKQMNIVVIIADDMGWADIGYNNPAVYTPTLDSLAAGGVRLAAQWLNEDQIGWFNDPAGKIQSESDPTKRLFLATVHHLDSAISNVVAALDRTGQRDNTIIFFSSETVLLNHPLTRLRLTDLLSTT